MLKDQIDGISFEDLVSRSEQISKLIKAMSLQILEIDSIEAEEKLLNVKKSWKVVQNEIAQVPFSFLISRKNKYLQIDKSDFAAEAGFSLQELLKNWKLIQLGKYCQL